MEIGEFSRFLHLHSSMSMSEMSETNKTEISCIVPQKGASKMVPDDELPYNTTTITFLTVYQAHI